MLTYEEIAEHLRTLRYGRDFWTWALHLDPWEGPYVTFVGQVKDSYSDKPLGIRFDTWLPPMFTTEQLDAFMQWRLWRVEGHEAREFLTRDGRPLFDPHAREATP